jgi:hypothetical protein
MLSKKNYLKAVKKLLFILLIGLSFSARAQWTAHDALAERWVNDTTGYEIKQGHMIRLHYNSYNGGTWEKNLYGDDWTWLGGALVQNNKVFESWAVSNFTSRRDYLTNGTEESEETAVFRVFRIEVIRPDLLKVSLSKPESVTVKNQYPPQVITPEMQQRWQNRKVFTTVLYLKKDADRLQDQ